LDESEVRQPVDADWGRSDPALLPYLESQPFFAVVLTPTLATVGDEVRLILSMTEIGAADLHCLPT
jgi:hypothetical protein